MKRAKKREAATSTFRAVLRIESGASELGTGKQRGEANDQKTTNY